MLDTTTKRRIDTARDILVGKVPDPKSQVEQITIALIYKFMDDMDAESEEFGGKRKFFAGEFARYGWAKLMRAGLGGHETLNLYAEAIAKMLENPGIPLLFRDIFKNAYLPYRDPETLRAFLKIIDEFSYDHSERLGDAFEYLLSVLGSQGDAGQFRTPRHIIDFMVAVVDPKKTDRVLDPACGTAGFLISAYKHILVANRTDMDEQDGQDENKESRESCPSMFVSSLTPDEKGRLAQNFNGYDISPDMVRLSLVNLYLHGFSDPHIAEYDTLTSQDKWNETADVILANPPFMSPKGGIKPHNRFGVQSKRSEVLFVDYMAEHLTPTGRAGIIVPEGIIFQSQTAYKALRKMLIENSLVAVVSLPAGCFNPYSGVKTSILILDKTLAKAADTIAFFKVENDGFGLGAQRRAIDKNDLPQVLAGLKEFIHMDRQDGQDKSRSSCKSCSSMLNALVERGLAQIVPKEKLAANGDYSLSGERYRESVVRSGQRWPTVPLSDVCSLQRGLSYSTAEVGDKGHGVPFYNLKSIKRQGVPQRNDFKYFTGEIKDRHLVEPGDVLIALTDLTPTSELIGSPKLITDPIKAAYSADLGKLVLKDATAQPQFLYHLLRSNHYREYIVTYSHGANVKHLQSDGFYAFQIPLPPLEVQKEIVAEIEGYQKVINGARAVLDHYRPHIPIHPDWPMVLLGDVFKLSSGRGLTQTNMKEGRYPVYGGNGRTGTHSEYFLETANIVIGRVGAYCGAVHITEPKAWVTDNGLYVTKFKQQINLGYLAQVLIQLKLNQFAKVGGQPSISQTTVYEGAIPLPPLATQQAIVAEIEAEQALVAANRELITRFEKKIQATLARIWGES